MGNHFLSIITRCGPESSNRWSRKACGAPGPPIPLMCPKSMYCPQKFFLAHVSSRLVKHLISHSHPNWKHGKLKEERKNSTFRFWTEQESNPGTDSYGLYPEVVHRGDACDHWSISQDSPGNFQELEALGTVRAKLGDWKTYCRYLRDCVHSSRKISGWLLAFSKPLARHNALADNCFCTLSSNCRLGCEVQSDENLRGARAQASTSHDSGSLRSVSYLLKYNDVSTLSRTNGHEPRGLCRPFEA